MYIGLVLCGIRARLFWVVWFSIQLTGKHCSYNPFGIELICWKAMGSLSSFGSLQWVGTASSLRTKFCRLVSSPQSSINQPPRPCLTPLNMFRCFQQPKTPFSEQLVSFSLTNPEKLIAAGRLGFVSPAERWRRRFALCVACGSREDGAFSLASARVREASEEAYQAPLFDEFVPRKAAADGTRAPGGLPHC